MLVVCCIVAYCSIQGRSVPYARTQVLPHRFDNLKKINILSQFFFFTFYSLNLDYVSMMQYFLLGL